MKRRREKLKIMDCSVHECVQAFSGTASYMLTLFIAIDLSLSQLWLV